MITVNIVVLIFLAIVVGFDLKTKKVPAMLTTAIILVLTIVNFNNINYGIIAFVFAWFLYEFDFIGGLADVKVITIIGLMITGIYGIFALMILVTIYGAIYRAAFGLILKKEVVAFTLPLFLIYITLWIISGHIGGIL